MKESRMIRMGVIGINHKLADLKLREQLAKTCQQRFGFLQSVHQNHYFILLSTCNRTEIYFCSNDLAETHSYILQILRAEVNEEFDHKLYSYFGLDCFSHLVRVTSGLDSAIIAETEIQGQVKKAYETVADFFTLPSEIHFLFQKSLGIAKKIRTDLQLGRGMPLLEDAILHTGKLLFKETEKTNVLFVGASEINQKILEFLKNKHFSKITLCNRTVENAYNLSQQFNIDLLPWSQLSSWIDYDWIIFGTKSSNYLISDKDIKNKKVSQKLIMDLSVPRNVEPKLGQHSKVTLLNIDQINRLLKIRHDRIHHILEEADHRISEATQQHVSRYLEKSEAKANSFAIIA
ncbi:MAG: glutamyl-tRNA reductase [Parachlamydiaceae bacterium]|nr:glutamyl-tRNA reductase [Parachlamydiaceae bacterium]